MYTLDPAKIDVTVAELERRIQQRFPDSGLSRLCRHLRVISEHACERSVEISRPNIGLRIAIGLLCVVVVAGTVFTIIGLRKPIGIDDFAELVQAIESGINDVIYIAVAIFFLTTLETRFKRRRALEAIHELRAIAHVIDMHQLTKDPEGIMSPENSPTGPPRRTMTRFELNRYLDFCSEMLSLVGKLAAVYVQHFDDSVVLEAATEVEELTTGLSQKIWQKIMLTDAST
jgi:hypothetical protein